MRGLSSVLVALSAACGGGAGDAPADAGSRADGHVEAGNRDGGGHEDGGPPVDGSPDAASFDSGAPPDAGPLRLLVFSRTEGYRHASIADGVAMLRELAGERGWLVEHTEELEPFTTAGLAAFDSVVFLNTTGDVLDAEHETALEAFVRGGGGWAGVHSASDTEYDWPFYGELVGAWFLTHPAVQEATIVVEDRTHPATAHLGERWMRRDEWYDFVANPRDAVTVLLSLDESTYSGGSMGDHPIAWHHEVGKGRAFYTGGGHTAESYAEPAFRAHVAGGIEWAARR